MIKKLGTVGIWLYYADCGYPNVATIGVMLFRFNRVSSQKWINFHALTRATTHETSIATKSFVCSFYVNS